MEMPSLEHARKRFRVGTILGIGLRMVAVTIGKRQCRHWNEYSTLFSGAVFMAASYEMSLNCGSSLVVLRLHAEVFDSWA